MSILESVVHTALRNAEHKSVCYNTNVLDLSSFVVERNVWYITHMNSIILLLEMLLAHIQRHLYSLRAQDYVLLFYVWPLTENLYSTSMTLSNQYKCIRSGRNRAGLKCTICEIVNTGVGSDWGAGIARLNYPIFEIRDQLKFVLFLFLFLFFTLSLFCSVLLV